MSANKWVVRVVDGQFCLGSGPDPVVYFSDQVNYTLVDLGDGAQTPNERTQKWNGSTVVARIQSEIDAFDVALRDAKANAIDNELLIQAVAQLDFEERQKLQVKAGQTLLTAQQAKARVKAIYRSLLGA